MIADKFVHYSGQAQLVILHPDGITVGEVPLPFTWDENDDLSPFADNLSPIPGEPDTVLYGRHAGNSTFGPAQMFYRVNLKGGQPTVVTRGSNLSWSSDHRCILTGDYHYLAPLDKNRQVWVSPLYLVFLDSGQLRALVQGLVDVGEFDWRRTKSAAR